MPCPGGCVDNRDWPGFCRECGKPMGGGRGLTLDHERPHPAIPGGKFCLNIHGHGGRSAADDSRIPLPANVEVAYWVFDGELYSAQLNPCDVTGNPTNRPVELDTISCRNYSTWALRPDEPAPNVGGAVQANLIDALRRAAGGGCASWKVNTGNIQGSTRGVITLSYICNTIRQVKGTAGSWRVNWLCCRERLV